MTRFGLAPGIATRALHDHHQPVEFELNVFRLAQFYWIAWAAYYVVLAGTLSHQELPLLDGVAPALCGSFPTPLFLPLPGSNSRIENLLTTPLLADESATRRFNAS